MTSISKGFAENIGRLTDSIGQRNGDQLQEWIKQGPGNNFWEQVKAGRAEFGHCVYICFLPFAEKEEIEAFLGSGEMPKSLNGQMAGAFVDATCVDELQKHIGGNFDQEQLTEAIGDLIEDTKPEFELPIMTLAVYKGMKLEDGSSLSAFKADVLEWWDTEAETVPYPGITKDKVKEMLQSRPRPLVQLLSTRCPLYAGENMNAWLDACRELGISVMIDAETTEGVKHLTDENRADTLTIPFGQEGGDAVSS